TARLLQAAVPVSATFAVPPALHGAPSRASAAGLCPSCGARQRCNEAANITDRVLPNVLVRPWVMSLPWELRGLAAARPQVLGAMARIFAEEIGRMSKKLTKVAGTRTGSVAAVQRFGGALHLHPPLRAAGGRRVH